jgi:hypothetical protein
VVLAYIWVNKWEWGMKKLYFLIVIVVAFSLSGCVSCRYPTKFTKLNNKNNKPFYDLIDKEVKLQRPVRVSNKSYYPYSDIDMPDTIIKLSPPVKHTFAPPNNILGDDYGELNSDPYYHFLYLDSFIDEDGVIQSLKLPEKLPAGTVIKFDSFWIGKDYAFFVPYKVRYMAWFRVPSLKLPEFVRFLYVWGPGRYLRRAPWEDDTVPDLRYVGFNGKSYDPE